MALVPWQVTILDGEGRPVSGARVSIRTTASGMPLATIYSDANGTAMDNPIVAGVNGLAQFYAVPGNYTATYDGDASVPPWNISLSTPDFFFDNVADLIADNVGNYPVGTLVRTRSEGFSYQAVASGGHVQNAGGQRFNVLERDGFYNVDAFNAIADGTTNSTAAIQAAINTGGNVLFGDGNYRASGLILNNNSQIIRGTGDTLITRNGNGTVFSGSGDDVVIEGLNIRGDTASSQPNNYTGDLVSMTGNRFSFLGGSAFWVNGRAIKSTGDYTVIKPTGVVATSQTGASAYDIELGVSGTATLYHEITGWNAASFDGGLLLIDTGTTRITDCVFGKYDIQLGTGPAGVNGGITKGCRIGGNINVGLSGAVFTANQPTSGVALTFGTGTADCRWDVSNTLPASVANNGNVASNLIRRNIGNAGTVIIRTGDDTNFTDLTFDLDGNYTFAGNLLLSNNHGLRIQDSGGTDHNAVSLSNNDDFFFGANNGANFTLLSSGTGGVSTSVNGVTIDQVYSGGRRPQLDNTYRNGTATQAWAFTHTHTVEYGNSGVRDTFGSGTPEGSVSAPVGSTYRRTDGGAGTTFYVKETGTGNTGWVAK